MNNPKNTNDFPKHIPLFPLSGVLLLPKSRLPLNIFEPRYLKMIEDVLATEHRFIGMIQPKTSNNSKNIPELYEIGCSNKNNEELNFLLELGINHESFNKDAFLEIISKYFTLTNLQTDWESLKKADDELLINSLSILCPFENDEKQALLEAKTIKERVKILTTLMEMSIKAETTFGPLQ